MSDNLCGPSAPTKGLINQLDRNNSHHQTRIVNARDHFDKNFRATAEAANAGVVKDADLNNFLTGPSPTPGNLMPFPMGDRTQFQNPIQGDQRNQQINQGPILGAPGRVSIDWVNDFRNMQLNHNQHERTQGAMSGGPVVNQAQPAYASTNHLAMHPLPAYSSQFLGPQSMPAFLGPQIQPGAQQMNAPQGPAMAASNTQALDDVFAELFAHADQAEKAAEEEAKTAETETAAEAADAMLRFEQSYQEEVNQWMAEEPENQIHQETAAEDDIKLRKAAQDIMQTLSTNQSEKFKNSTFIDLMNRIAQKEVVLQGNDLFDTTTGTALGDRVETLDDPKGKGKAREEVADDTSTQHAA